MKKLIILSTLLICNSLTNAQDSTAIKYANTITAAELSIHLHELASDKYEGRETGMKGQKMATTYLANHFKSIHVAPGNKGSYFQEFPVILQYSGGTEIAINNHSYNFLSDFYFYRGFKDTTFTASEIIFAGYGIDDKNYSDYKKIDVKGKVVMVLSGEPYKKGKSVVSKSKNASHWSIGSKLKREAAKFHGAKAILIIPNNIESNVETMLHYIESPSMLLNLGEVTFKSSQIPRFYISEAMADTLLQSSRKTVKQLKEKITKKTITITCNSNLSISMNRKQEQLTASNVLGFIEGTDKKEEIVVLTAHYDHIGIQDTIVYNGADDDGSGTVALLELAQAFQQAKDDGNGPRRSILIMPVSGEEKGLLGSDYYTKNPVYPLANTVVDLNIDMIGRMDKKHEGNPNYVYIIGSSMLSNELHQISENANNTFTHIELDYEFNNKTDKNRYYYRSDHYNFAKNNIPVIFYFNGTHADYHKPTDTVEKIHFGKIEKITKLVFYTAWEIANREEKLKLNEPIEK